MAPGTRFNGPVTAHRVLDARFFPFAELKPIRNLVPGATVNDVALAVIGGAMRSYLEKAGELPGAPLRAMTPVSVRTEAEKGDLGNQVSAMVVSLATDSPTRSSAWPRSTARPARRRRSPRPSGPATWPSCRNWRPGCSSGSARGCRGASPGEARRAWSTRS